ncbi:MAG: tetratricopeptide repeat protein [Planctomycetota bacterium]|jgi:tetratricopeptide (TPR) repeat protein
MISKAQLVGLVLLVCAFLLGGCDVFQQDETTKGPRVDANKQTRAELLKQLDRKFENPDAHFELGELYQADGLWREAEYHYRTALSFDPVHWPAQAGLVKVHLKSGQNAKSKLSAEIYMNQVSASAERSLQLGLAFQKQDLGDYALTCYQQALHLQPHSAGIHRQIGFYYLAQNDKGRAKEYLVRSFQIDPYQADVAAELGRMGVKIEVPRKAQQSTLQKILPNTGG